LVDERTHQSDRVGILTIEAASPGGVPALVDTLYESMQHWGFEPTIYRASFAEGHLSFVQRVWVTLRHWLPQEVQERGHRTVLIPAPPLPLWLFYLAPHFLTGPLLGQYSTLMVASGSAHVALPLALRGIPYTLWIATLYEDELRAKEDAGDSWARKVLASATWPILKAQERFVLRHAARILALSPYTERRIRETLPDVADRIETVLYPVDTERFRPDLEAKTKSRYGRYLLTAARINDPRKNVEMLVRAFAEVSTQMPDMKLVLVGDAPEPGLIEIVDELGLRGSVEFPGIVDKDELLKLYQGADLFVLPSRQEGLGIVMLEAMACGTPVITTAYGGPEDIVIDGETGLHLPANTDEAGLAQAIIDLLRNKAQRVLMSTQCVEFAKEHYSAPHIAQQLRSGYDAAQAYHPPMRFRAAIAAVWGLIVVAAYVQHQAALHWDAVQSLLNTLQ
jgi:D-inositol-3-phosphate glycosyltransferase